MYVFIISVLIWTGHGLDVFHIHVILRNLEEIL